MKKIILFFLLTIFSQACDGDYASNEFDMNSEISTTTSSSSSTSSCTPDVSWIIAVGGTLPEPRYWEVYANYRITNANHPLQVDFSSALSRTFYGSQYLEANTELFGVAYGNRVFVKVGEAGTIFTLPTPVTRNILNMDKLVPRSSGTTSNLNKVAYGISKFVAVGDQGTIVSSSDDGATWGDIASGTSKDLNNITFANDKFVIVGDNSTILSSSDGISWTDRSAKVDNRSLSDVEYGNNIFVAVGSKGGYGCNPALYTSPDGDSWTSRDMYTGECTYNNFEYSNVSSVAYGTPVKTIVYGESKDINLFIAIGKNERHFSADGINWSTLVAATPDKYDVNYIYSLNTNSIIFIPHDNYYLSDLTILSKTNYKGYFQTVGSHGHQEAQSWEGNVDISSPGLEFTGDVYQQYGLYNQDGTGVTLNDIAYGEWCYEPEVDL